MTEAFKKFTRNFFFKSKFTYLFSLFFRYEFPELDQFDKSFFNRKKIYHLTWAALVGTQIDGTKY
jgi:hypothetical protein